MILKLMDSNHLVELQDDNPLKGHRIVDQVREVTYRTLDATKEAAIDVVFERALRGLESETFILSANAYLMNDAGKTIQVFHPQLDPH